MLLKRNSQLFQISGSDSRLRLWDVETGCNTLVNFEASRLQTSKAIQLAVSDDSSLVFVPCVTAVKVLIEPFFLFVSHLSFFIMYYVYADSGAHVLHHVRYPMGPTWRPT